MLFWILIVLAVALGIWFGREEGSIAAGIFAFLMSFLISVAISSIISVFVVAIFGQEVVVDWEYDFSEPVEIASIRNDSGVNGSFFLGCGSIDSVSYYIYYVKEGEDRYHRDKIKITPKVSIVEMEKGSTDLPRIVKKISRQRFRGWIFYPITWSEWKYTGDAEIFVPKGTIIQDFQLN